MSRLWSILLWSIAAIPLLILVTAAALWVVQQLSNTQLPTL